MKKKLFKFLVRWGDNSTEFRIYEKTKTGKFSEHIPSVHDINKMSRSSKDDGEHVKQGSILRIKQHTKPRRLGH